MYKKLVLLNENLHEPNLSKWDMRMYDVHF